MNDKSNEGLEPDEKVIASEIEELEGGPPPPCPPPPPMDLLQDLYYDQDVPVNIKTKESVMPQNDR